MYPIFALWVRSHTDLPLKTYQLVNTFRYETKQTRAFIRVREIHFFESHTCHVDEADAQRQVEEDFVILENLMAQALPPVLAAQADRLGQVPWAPTIPSASTPLMPEGKPAARFDPPLPGELLPAVRHQVRGHRRQHASTCTRPPSA